MRILSKLVTGSAIAAAAITLAAAAPALADPPPGVTPAPNSVVAVGSDTIQNVFDQFSVNFNASHGGRKLFSWDALNPKGGPPHDMIRFKRGCPLEPRPNGSSEGITAVKTNLGGTTAGNPCEDLARSSRDRATTDPPFAAGGLAFVTLAGDAVTWSTPAVTHAPRSLTAAQLTAIYQCRITNWSRVGGRAGAIKAFLPQSGSGTRAFFLKALGLTTSGPGPCVISPATLEENQGVNPILQNINAIYPFSIGKYIAERFHSATCLNRSCTPVRGVQCRPRGGQNLFGCDTHGTYILHAINRNPPTVGTGRNTRINPGFVPAFVRTLFEVVRFAPGTADHIPAYLEPFFGHRGFVCAAPIARTDLLNYGFLLKATCGNTH